MLKKFWAWILAHIGKRVRVQLPSGAVVKVKEE